jgi:D-aspartate ligase
MTRRTGVDDDAPVVPGPARPVPCVLLHGDVNALTVARSLGRLGVPVYALNDAVAPVTRSRFVTPLVLDHAGQSREDAWTEYLLGPESDHLRGSVLLACSDIALRILAAHRDALASRYVLDLADPAVQVNMLDKRASLEVARRSGIGHPKFWVVSGTRDVGALAADLPFPVLVKPVDTFRFFELTGHKILVVDGPEELMQGVRAVAEAGLEFVIVELIPGGDDLLCSYYTYLDEDGNPQFHFTKTVIRRFPSREGPAVHHAVDWIPDAAEEGLQFLQAAGVRGIGHVEFKRDPRDGRLKFIESNVRFTAGNGLLTASGIDLARYVYDRATNGHRHVLEQTRDGLHLLHPVLDVRAVMELRARGEVTIPAWIGSLAHPQVLAWFAADDLGPSLLKWRRGLADGARGLTRKARRAYRRLTNQSPSGDS